MLCFNYHFSYRLPNKGSGGIALTNLSLPQLSAVCGFPLTANRLHSDHLFSPRLLASLSRIKGSPLLFPYYFLRCLLHPISSYTTNLHSQFPLPHSGSAPLCLAPLSGKEGIYFIPNVQTPYGTSMDF